MQPKLYHLSIKATNEDEERASHLVSRRKSEEVTIFWRKRGNKRGKKEEEKRKRKAAAFETRKWGFEFFFSALEACFFKLSWGFS